MQLDEQQALARNQLTSPHLRHNGRKTIEFRTLNNGLVRVEQIGIRFASIATPLQLHGYLPPSTSDKTSDNIASIAPMLLQ